MPDTAARPWRFVVTKAKHVRRAAAAGGDRNDDGVDENRIEFVRTVYRAPFASWSVLAAAEPKVPEWEQQPSAGAAPSDCCSRACFGLCRLLATNGRVVHARAPRLDGAEEASPARFNRTRTKARRTVRADVTRAYRALIAALNSALACDWYTASLPDRPSIEPSNFQRRSCQ